MTFQLTVIQTGKRYPLDIIIYYRFITIGENVRETQKLV